MRDDDTPQDALGGSPAPGPALAMVEAFAHAAGSIARHVAGGATGFKGVLLHIHVAPGASYEMEELQEAQCVAGRGIVGDRYYEGSGTYSPKPDTREVTLIEQEALDALARNDPPLQGGPIALAPGDHRRNLTVRGVPLNHLVGRRFRVGDVILRGGRLNFPCKYLEELLGLQVYLPLYNRSGLNCGIERGGVIRPGDAIELLDDDGA
ncbi:MOSC domain-containing protein YiiM [Methylopila capsulata]|uniref:MOSC domain-containing protein YiiM n=2 Tax=Methylopila capsulata TaxID=61654 RepID=A0A9W6IQA2_9HYPH|nr:MOSC domain-containing protein YiiM [Methylopila capsulata]GLK54557.1 molybdenum cofactor biosynthesis protein [Methylopila capsulata]